MKGNKDKITPEIIINIRAKIPQMSPAAKKAASYIVQNFEKLEGIQINHLARESGVSEATITRFVKDIGFKNYQSFSLQIAKEGIGYVSNNCGYTSIGATDSIETICDKVFSVNLQTLKDTRSILNLPEIEKVSKLILEGKRIVIFAQGRSVITARSLRQRLRRLKIYCELYEDPHEGAIASALLGTEDVAIGISTYGKSRMVVTNMKRAQGNKAATIGVTSYENNPLEKYCDVILRTVNNENLAFGYEPSCATITQMVMLDCLYMILHLQMEDKAEKYLESTFKALEEERL